MLTVNTMRYGTDNFVFRKQTLLTTSKAWDTTGKTDIEGFELAGIEPADSNRRVIFQVDNKYYKFDSTQNLVEYTDTVDFDSILVSGNTVEELSKVTAIPAWVGKKIYPIIALDSAPDATVFPSIKIALKTRCNQDQYQKSEESAEYTLANASDKALPRIIDVTPSVIVTGKATATVQVAVRDNNGTWSSYMSLTDAKDKQCSAVKYKATYTVTTLDGTDSAHVDSVTIRYANGSAAVSGDTAEIYSITNNYEDGLQYCQALIKHKALIDSQIKAYISFRNEPKTRKMVSIGTGNGKEQTLILGVSGIADNGINQNKLSIYVDGELFYNYSYNTETSEITLTVDNGAAISASYEYGWEPETWLEMTAGAVEPYHDNSSMYSSRFTYTLADTSEKKTISNVKFVLYRPQGHVDSASLGKASGNRQVMVLPHMAKKETIVCNGSWSYDEDTKVLTVVATKDTDLVISYDWVGESQEVYGYTAGWSVVA
jgi:hypothetical protein